MMKFSIIIPAHDEEKSLGACLDSIARAASSYARDVEVIVVLNRCSDGTERIAREGGAKVAREDSPNLSKIRNAGARNACGDILVTIDADSRMSENLLTEIDRALAGGKYIGGGVPIVPERTSPGITATFLFLRFFLLVTGLAGGVYWCFRRDFEAIGGFNEALLVGEDMDFAKRLRAYGKPRGLKFTSLGQTHIVTSCRKFDHFGDWYFLKVLFLHPIKIRRGIHGRDLSLTDKYFYDFKGRQ